MSAPKNIRLPTLRWSEASPLEIILPADDGLCCNLLSPVVIQSPFESLIANGVPLRQHETGIFVWRRGRWRRARRTPRRAGL